MTNDEQFSSDEPWIAVRCLFSHPNRKSDSEKNLYEERITLWRASSFREAYTLAEAEALTYAESDECIFVRATDAFHLFDGVVSNGSEIWSIMRGSGMGAEQYANTFCSTPSDRAAYHSKED
jgi:hypothetical protein